MATSELIEALQALALSLIHIYPATVFTGTSADADPVMSIDLGKPTPVTALRYTLQGLSLIHI